jgi:hypothetical protein
MDVLINMLNDSAALHKQGFLHLPMSASAEFTLAAS